ncbi:hypothetical protein OHC33_011132 [Knufia fluminis]|uniref:Uncharacterized protein n=1 Tax=Knufia fluminis TaxID=191047 RepID=A0AAN8EIF8_9EURO|nr:hypothetical protein OHC33_011132 [Knufia fluminis]
MELTVGYVSGLIAALIFVLQILLPNVLVVVVVGLLTKSHSAVTWSVVERNLLSSLWPVFLNADSAVSDRVELSVRLLTWMRPLGLGLIAIAAVVTPLGLYEEVAPDRQPQPSTMTYLPDTGPFGIGTLPRNHAGFSRLCGSFQPLQCPGTTVVIEYDEEYDPIDNVTLLSNGTISKGEYYDTRIPEFLWELYQSGLSLQSRSVSSFFDIETRQFTFRKQSNFGIDKPYTVDFFQYLKSIHLDNALKPVEGLVTDTISGGVGFRHHTAPTISGTAAEWSEDILFIEPEIVCVPSNLSYEFQLPWETDPLGPQVTNLSIVDEGGFVDIMPEYPILDLNDTQRDPQLWNRAYKAAWMTNAYTMVYMNITRPAPHAFAYMNSKVGQRWPLTKDQAMGVSPYSANFQPYYGMVQPPTYMSNYTFAKYPEANYSNPFGISMSNYSSIHVICSGAGGQDTANTTRPSVVCGLVFGAARRTDGDESLAFVPGTWWKQPIYSCAGISKATIKSVQFVYNVTEGSKDTLEALSVQTIQDKEYEDVEHMPLWGVETVDVKYADIAQLWGLISPARQKLVNLITVQSPRLYLPGYMGDLNYQRQGAGYLPGASGPVDIMTSLFDSLSASDGTQDYSGKTNVATLLRWREASKTAAGVSIMLRRIWTDKAANLLTGTRGWNTRTLTPGNLLPNPRKRQRQSQIVNDHAEIETLVPVTIYKKRVRYRGQFAIPAFLSIALVGLTSVGALILSILRKSTPAKINHYLKQLSTGRLLSAMQHPGESDQEASTEEWLSQVGHKSVQVDQWGAASRSDSPPTLTLLSLSTKDTLRLHHSRL